METFHIRAVATDDTYTLRLAGEADLAVADDVVAHGIAGLEDVAMQNLVIDLADVTFVDSTVLGSLVKLSVQAEHRTKAFALVNVPDRVQRTLTISGLDSLFTIS